MRCTLRMILLLVIACHALSMQSQVNKAKVDSLYKAYLKETTDTGKVSLLLAISYQYEGKEKVKGLSFAREALELSRRISFQQGVCYSASAVGDYYYKQLNYAEGLKNYFTAADAGEKAGMHFQLCQIYNVMGIMYSNQDRKDQALKYFLKVAKIAEEHKYRKRLAVSYNNIGICYKDLGRYTDAKKYYAMALEQFEQMDYKTGIGSTSSNLGIISHMLKDDEAALRHYKMAMEAFRSINDTVSEAGIYSNIGELYKDQKQYAKSLGYYMSALEKAKKFNNVPFTDDAYEGLSKLYAVTGDYEKAYSYNQLHLKLKDSMNNEEGMRQVQEMEKRLENEKQEKEIQILKQNKEIQDLKVSSQSARLRQNSILISAVLSVLLIVLLMSFFIYKAYKQIKRTNVELAEKKKEIQDSINYAKNIQEAMLPDVQVLKRYFPEGFGLFMPKDVVSGDFYWFSELNGRLYFAVADCTGHGVPGGFMSMIGIDKLNQALNDKKLEGPGDLLAFLNAGIKQALKQTADSSLSRDGMDIAVCSFDKDTLQLRYAGANRPLWLVRNNELIEHKATKASIGGFTEDEQRYGESSIQLQKGDALYLFSDGYADQFGGPKRKKFMTKQLKQVIIENHSIPMSKQEERFKKIFDDWKGDAGQVDDVLLFGVRI
ncbi:MAG: protein serine/threonine phosphatase [Bacteroidetes bacterium]|nr:protein serine/threonine phosphatase [Bacteroidota bacterium]